LLFLLASLLLPLSTAEPAEEFSVSLSQRIEFIDVHLLELSELIFGKLHLFCVCLDQSLSLRVSHVTEDLGKSIIFINVIVTVVVTIIVTVVVTIIVTVVVTIIVTFIFISTLKFIIRRNTCAIIFF